MVTPETARRTTRPITEKLARLTGKAAEILVSFTERKPGSSIESNMMATPRMAIMSFRRAKDAIGFNLSKTST